MSAEDKDNKVTDSSNKKNLYRFPVSREMLYKQVWAKPMTELGKEYAVSSSYLARICARLNVPRP